MVKPMTRRFTNIYNTSKTDVAPWCYKWVDWTGWKSPGGGMYRAPHGANNNIYLRIYMKIYSIYKANHWFWSWRLTPLTKVSWPTGARWWNHWALRFTNSHRSYSHPVSLMSGVLLHLWLSHRLNPNHSIRNEQWWRPVICCHCHCYIQDCHPC